MTEHSSMHMRVVNKVNFVFSWCSRFHLSSSVGFPGQYHLFWIGYEIHPFSPLLKTKKNIILIMILVQSLSRVRLLGTPWTALPCPLPTPGAYSNSCPFSQWCHPIISSYVAPFSSCLQSFPAPGCLPLSQFFTSSGQSIGVSASASVFPVNIQDWFPLGLIGLISLQSKGLSRVFSNTTSQKHHFGT